MAIGLDPAKLSDFTGLVIAEERQRPTGRHLHSPAWHRKVGQPWNDNDLGLCSFKDGCRPETESVFVVHSFGRVQMLPYTEVAKIVASEVAALNQRNIQPMLRIDSTGLGEPVVDLVASELLGLSCRITRVTTTAGTGINGEAFSPSVTVSKLHLVSRLSALIESGRVRLPKRDRRIDAMIHELTTYRTKLTASGGFAAGARSGAHDDLISALALATLFDSTAGNWPVKVPSPYG